MCIYTKYKMKQTIGVKWILRMRTTEFIRWFVVIVAENSCEKISLGTGG